MDDDRPLLLWQLLDVGDRGPRRYQNGRSNHWPFKSMRYEQLADLISWKSN